VPETELYPSNQKPLLKFVDGRGRVSRLFWGKSKIELSPRLADILGLRRLASAEQIAARVAALDGKPPPRRTDTCQLLAAVALLGDDLTDNYRGVSSDQELLPAWGSEIGEEFLEELGPVSERELADDLALTDAEFLGEVRGYVANHPRLAVQEHLASLLESIIVEAYVRGWLRRDPPRSPQEIALKKLAKRRAKLAKRRGQKP